jgi:hypothetical protein
MSDTVYLTQFSQDTNKKSKKKNSSKTFTSVASELQKKNNFLQKKIEIWKKKIAGNQSSL